MITPKPRLTASRPAFLLFLSVSVALAAAVALLSLLGPAAASAQSSILYVDAGAAGAGDGSSWVDAFPTLQHALAAAGGGDEIWVAAGVYYPDEGTDQTSDDRSSTFELQNGVAIYGGFAGTETGRDQRNWESNVTVLSGDIDYETNPDTTDENGVVTHAEDIVGNNAYHVVSSQDTDSSAVLDGFVVTAGLADGEVAPDDTGGGLLNLQGSATLANLTITGNFAGWSGGGIYNERGALMLNNVVLTGNFAGLAGGGLYNYESDSTLTGVVFVGNEADLDGGGMYNEFSSPSLQDVTFLNNWAGWYGGGMANSGQLFSVETEGSLDQADQRDGSGERYERRRAPALGQDPALEDGESLQLPTAVTAPELTDVAFVNNVAQDVGGGMFNVDSTPILSDVIFVENEAGAGGGMFMLGERSRFRSSAGVAPKSSSAANNAPALSGVFFVNNVADVGGGLFSLNISPTIHSSSFISNFAMLGGGMLNSGGSPTLSEVHFVVNVGLFGGGLTNIAPPSDNGRGLFEELDDLGREELLQAEPPAVLAEHFSAHRTTLKERLSSDGYTVENLTGDFRTRLEDVEQRLASANGVPSLTLSDVTFSQNLSLFIGGGFLNGGSAQLTRVHFEQNIAIGVEEETVGIGGGMVQLEQDSFIVSAGLAAAEGISGTSLTDVTFVNNFAEIGGGLVASGVSESQLEAESSVFNGASSLKLLNVAFTGNVALEGGGMATEFASPALANVSFSGNVAEYGGAMINVDSEPIVTNGSFSANWAIEEGGAMFNADSYPLVQNSIFWVNEDGQAVAPGIVNENSTPLFTHSLVQGSGGSAAWDSSLGTDGGNNIDADPLFTRLPDPGDGDWSTLSDNDYGDLRLQTASPAVDVGDNGADLDGPGSGTATISDVSSDLAGNPRIVNAVVDMGAYELQSAELALVKSPSAQEVLPGQPLTYTLSFNNSGLGPAGEIMVIDEIPALLSNVSYEATVPVTPTAGSSYSWEVADLAPGAAGMITVSGVVSDALSADTTFTNTATISTARLDTEQEDNSDSAPVTVVVPRVSFSTESDTVGESAGTATITVMLDATNPYADVQVAYETADGTATAGSDYTATSGVLTIAAGAGEATFTVPIVDDDEAEPDETLLLSLSEPQGAALAAPETTTLTILNDDPHLVYMPLIVRQEPPGLPDLVISDLIVDGDELQVVVANVGDGPVTDTFWVDAYVNPDSPPVTVNDVWWIVGQEGMVWGITNDALPLQVGETITLTVGDAYYDPIESGFSGVIPAGAELYAQADSAHTGDPFGGVVETHEAEGGSYNNILGPVTAPGTLQITVPTGAAPRPAGLLPPR